MASTGNQGFGGREGSGQQPGRPGLSTGPGNAPRSDEGTLGGMATAVKDKAQDMASAVASTAEDAWESTRQGASAVAHTAEDAWGEVTGLMRRYPFGTLCLGIGVGFMLSRLLEDRGRRDLARWGSSLYDTAREYASKMGH